MEIKVNCRLKVASGVWIGPGMFNDNEKSFHPKIYGEIVMGRPTVALLSGTMEEAKRRSGGGVTVEKADEKQKATTTQDPGSDLDTATTEPEKKSRRTKR